MSSPAPADPPSAGAGHRSAGTKWSITAIVTAVTGVITGLSLILAAVHGLLDEVKSVKQELQSDHAVTSQEVQQVKDQAVENLNTIKAGVSEITAAVSAVPTPRPTNLTTVVVKKTVVTPGPTVTAKPAPRPGVVRAPTPTPTPAPTPTPDGGLFGFLTPRR